MRRASTSIMPIACSAQAMFGRRRTVSTLTPRAVQASTSIFRITKPNR